MDLPGFLELAGRLGGGVLYLRAVPFDPDAADGDQPEDPPAHLIRHKGQTGQVSVAFAANGVVHFWEHHTAWFAEWEELADATVARPGMDEDDGTEPLSPEERPGWSPSWPMRSWPTRSSGLPREVTSCGPPGG